jgi:hypothetical protein
VVGGKIYKEKESVLQAQFNIWALFFLSGFGIYSV